ncbi:MAG: hypothetical protein KY476_04155 [Planctomycetes bacterium]|nr:hypothetical protein [Planctomycetota bacterium]
MSMVSRIMLAAGLRTVAGAALSLLIAFAIVEGARIGMIGLGVTRPSHDAWVLFSGVQQTAWQLELVCLGALVVGCALLRVGSRAGTMQRWAGAAVLFTGLTVASRTTLLYTGTILMEYDWRFNIAAWATFTETTCLLATLLAFDMVVRALADRAGDDELRAFAASHATFVLCLSALLLFRQLTDTAHHLIGAMGRLEVCLRLVLGSICLAWTVRLARDAARTCRSRPQSAS